MVVRVKLICDWLKPHEIYNYWNKLSKGDCKWNNIQVVGDGEDVDYFCIINKPNNNSFIEEKTIFMPMEPKIHTQYFNWLNKRKPNFLYTLNRQNIEWWLQKTYTQLMNEEINKTKLISVITSSKYFDDGHRKRLNFLKFIENKNFNFDYYGKGNRFNLKNYLGELPLRNKNDGLLPYKYTIACENTQEKNYFTEKLVDGILGECLCFYWGCPNISDFIDERVIIILDLDNFEKSLETIKEAIKNNEWEKRIDIIKKEKLKILNELQFFPTLERIINTLN